MVCLSTFIPFIYSVLVLPGFLSPDRTRWLRLAPFRASCPVTMKQTVMLSYMIAKCWAGEGWQFCGPGGCLFFFFLWPLLLFIACWRAKTKQQRAHHHHLFILYTPPSLTSAWLPSSVSLCHKVIDIVLCLLQGSLCSVDEDLLFFRLFSLSLSFSYSSPTVTHSSTSTVPLSYTTLFIQYLPIYWFFLLWCVLILKVSQRFAGLIIVTYFMLLIYLPLCWWRYNV